MLRGLSTWPVWVKWPGSPSVSWRIQATFSGVVLAAAAVDRDALVMASRPRSPQAGGIDLGRWGRRLGQLYVGLVLYGVSAGMQVRARLGLNPWDVLHQGISHRVHHAIGTVSIVLGAVLLLAWLPLRQRPGLGTISNVVVIGLALNATVAVLPPQHGYPARIAMLVVAIVLCGVGSGMYISAGLGPGPRDGLMTGIAARTGMSVRVVRTGIELTVLACGWLLGGSVGVGTVAFALVIGPLTQRFMGLLSIAGVAQGHERLAAPAREHHLAASDSCPSPGGSS